MTILASKNINLANAMVSILVCSENFIQALPIWIQAVIYSIIPEWL